MTGSVGAVREELGSAAPDPLSRQLFRHELAEHTNRLGFTMLSRRVILRHRHFPQGHPPFVHTALFNRALVTAPLVSKPDAPGRRGQPQHQRLDPRVLTIAHHRRTRLLPLLLAQAGTPESPGAGRGIPVGGSKRRSRLAHAFLAVVRADEHRLRPGPDDLIPLTCYEIHRLFTALVGRPVHEAGHWLRWSHWRCRHEARSRAIHYSRQAASRA